MKKKAVPNRQGERCAFCRKDVGTEPIFDAESLTYWICTLCERSMEWN